MSSRKADIARFLGWLLSEPDEEMAETVKTGKIYHLFSTYFQSTHGQVPPMEGFLLQEDRCDLLKRMRKEYHRLFKTPTAKDLWWVESVHKAWTNDPGCRLPMASEKGYLMGDSALHMMDLYRSVGIEVPEEFCGLPDHIVLELEFFAILLEASPREAAQTFQRDHLDWIPEMVKKGRAYEPSPFYSSVFNALESFIAVRGKNTGREEMLRAG